MRKQAALAVLVLSLAGGRARADVVDKAANGFTIKVVLDVAAPPDVVYTSLVRHVGEWWDPAHTYSGAARNLSIVVQPGGCFCEALPGGGGVQHATVVNLVPGKMLRMTGALGPLQQSGASGAMTWQIEAAPKGSVLTFTYVVGGYIAGGVDTMATPVDQVMTRQVQLLKAYSEKVARN